jgi:hypothetical protein
MFSFATLSAAGFGGYVCMTGSLLGTGRIRGVLTRLEARLLADGRAVHGWYVECAGEPERSIFCKVGFVELAVPYSQPASAAGALPEHPLHLLYKPIGPARSPLLPAGALLSDVRDIYRHIYGIPQPQDTAAYQRLAQALTGSAAVPLRTRRPVAWPPADLTPR